MCVYPKSIKWGEKVFTLSDDERDFKMVEVSEQLNSKLENAGKSAQVLKQFTSLFNSFTLNLLNKSFLKTFLLRDFREASRDEGRVLDKSMKGKLSHEDFTSRSWENFVYFGSISFFGYRHEIRSEPLK